MRLLQGRSAKSVASSGAPALPGGVGHTSTACTTPVTTPMNTSHERCYPRESLAACSRIAGRKTANRWSMTRGSPGRRSTGPSRSCRSRRASRRCRFAPGTGRVHGMPARRTRRPFAVDRRCGGSDHVLVRGRETPFPRQPRRRGGELALQVDDLFHAAGSPRPAGRHTANPASTPPQPTIVST